MKYWLLYILSISASLVAAQPNLGFGQEQELNNVLKGSFYPLELPSVFSLSTRHFYKNQETTSVPLGIVYTRYLDIKEQAITLNMEGIPIEYALETKNFCIIYNGSICIPEDENYTLKINSDDGAKMWLDDKTILDKDVLSQMSKTDTVSLPLKKGSHKVKIWYFQGLDSNMGLQVQIKKTREAKYKVADFLCIPFEKEEFVSLSSQILFATGKSILKPEATAAIGTLANKIRQEGYTNIILDGHTDNKGSDEINQKLSLARANAIMTALKKILVNDKINYQIFGHGASIPVADNTTEEGRNINRRVDVKLVK
jgi:outer membrane protein OmpA-like peptidoglycan-associated protein